MPLWTFCNRNVHTATKWCIVGYAMGIVGYVRLFHWNTHVDHLFVCSKQGVLRILINITVHQYRISYNRYKRNIELYGIGTFFVSSKKLIQKRYCSISTLEIRHWAIPFLYHRTMYSSNPIQSWHSPLCTRYWIISYRYNSLISSKINTKMVLLDTDCNNTVLSNIAFVSLLSI